MILGYNTSGLAHHSLLAAIKLLAEIGYRSVAITLDHATLNPYGKHFEAEVHEAQTLLRDHSMTSVIETGARYLLDPVHKHEPTLLADNAADRSRRIDFLRHAIDIAFSLESDCVSLWSGRLLSGMDTRDAIKRLADSLHTVLEHAALENMTIAFEPEPGMLIDTTAKFTELLSLVDSQLLKLTLDVGHLHCLGETPIADVIHQWRERLVNVHIEDMRAGIHEHLMFGEGEIDFPPVIAALRDVGYDGPLNVELSRHSHVGPLAAKQAFDFLRPLIELTKR
ncbi:MAG: sugar phosphate isomerase/epimerase family protein [Bythopirellula sp.]|nr:sugar phosphate isomerase/epimerase family protein [Bythopirellula sp.]